MLTTYGYDVPSHLSREQKIERLSYIARRLKNKHQDYYDPTKRLEQDDIYQAAMIGIIDAVDHYDDSKGMKLNSYACTCAKHAVLDLMASSRFAPRSMQKQGKQIAVFSLDSFITAETHTGFSDILIDHSLPDMNKTIQEDQQMESLKYCIDKLSDREKVIIENKLQEATFQDIASLLGITQARVQQLYARALEKMRKTAMSLNMEFSI